MRCPRCNGKGGRDRPAQQTGACSQDLGGWRECDLCEGTGAVTHVKTETRGGKYETCYRCDGSGKVIRSIQTGTYPSGKRIYEDRRATCDLCNGSGKYWVKETKEHYYEPDRGARQGGCYVVSTTFGRGSCEHLFVVENCRTTLLWNPILLLGWLVYQFYGPILAAWARSSNSGFWWCKHLLGNPIVRAIGRTGSRAFACTCYLMALSVLGLVLLVPCSLFWLVYRTVGKMNRYDPVPIDPTLCLRYRPMPIWSDGGGI